MESCPILIRLYQNSSNNFWQLRTTEGFKTNELFALWLLKSTYRPTRSQKHKSETLFFFNTGTLIWFKYINMWVIDQARA